MSVIIRIALAAVLVGAVGIVTGTIKPSKVLDRVPRPHTVVLDERKAYLDMVDDNFSRLQPLSDGFFTSCKPDSSTTATCAVLAEQMLRALGVFKLDLDRAKVPESFTSADTALRRAVAKGIQGFRLVERAVRTHRKRDWLRARNLLGETGALLERATHQLPASGS